MSRLQLSSATRADFRKSETKRFRREGKIPATVYTRGETSQSVAISADELGVILKTPGGRLSLIDLAIDGSESKAHPVMIQDMQRDPVSKKIMHVDFHRVSMNEPVQASVPVVIVGEAPGVKLGGILEQLITDLDIKALPDHIPTHIDVDVSHLEMGQSILISEVNIPADAELVNASLENMLVTVRTPTVRTEEAVAPTEAPAEAAG